MKSYRFFKKFLCVLIALALVIPSFSSFSLRTTVHAASWNYTLGNLVATKVSSTTVDLTYDQSQQLIELYVDGVYHSDMGWGVTRVTGLNPSTTHTFSIYVYTFDVDDYYDVGTRSVTTIAGSVVPSTAVTNFKGSATSGNNIYATWTKHQQAQYYDLYLNGTKVATKNYDQIGYTFSGLLPNVKNTLGIVARNDDGSSPMATFDFYPTPTGLKVNSSTSNSITIGWDAVSDSPTYNTYRNNSKWTATTNSYTFGGLTANYTQRLGVGTKSELLDSYPAYIYATPKVVKASSGTLYSFSDNFGSHLKLNYSFSQDVVNKKTTVTVSSSATSYSYEDEDYYEVTATPSTATPPVSINGVTQSTFVINHDANGNPLIATVPVYSTVNYDNGSTEVVSAEIPVPKLILSIPDAPTGFNVSAGTNYISTSWNKDYQVNAYNLYYKKNDGVDTWHSTGDFGTGETINRSISGLTDDTSYSAYLVSKNSFGYSQPSPIVTFVTKPLSIPNLKGISKTPTSITIDFSELGYTNWADISLNGVYQKYLEGASTYTFSGLSPNTQYDIEVYGEFGDDWYEIDETISVITPSTTAPAAPSNLFATSIKSDSFRLRWGGGTNKDGGNTYDIYKNGTLIASNFTPNTVPAVFPITGLSSGTTYTIGVVAKNANGSSSMSTVNISTSTASDLGIKPYFSFDSYSIGNKNESLNVNKATGNVILNVQDESLYTKGVQGFTFTRTYNSKSDKVSMLGKGWTFTGNESLKKDTISLNVSYLDESGTELLFLKNGDGTFTRPNGSYLTLSSATVNGTNGFKITDKNQFVKNFEVNPTNGNTYRLYSYNDKYGNEIRFTYNSSGQLIKIAETGSSRKSIDFTYATGKIYATYSNHKMTYEISNDQLMKATLSAIDGNGVELTNKLTTQYLYDGNGQVIKVTDPKGNATQISYPVNTVVVNTTATANNSAEETKYIFNPSQNTCTVGSTVYTRDAAANSFAISKITDGTEITNIFYDANFNVTETNVTKDGIVSSVDKTTYDSNGNVLTQTDKDNKKSTFEYDSSNRLTKSTDTNSKVTTYSYTGNSSTTVTSGTETTKYEYDAYGRTVKMTYPNGTYDTTTYEGQGPLSQRVTDKDGNYTTTIFTDFGKVASVTDKAGRVISYTYDPLFIDQIVTVTDGLGKVTTYSYDASGNLLSLKDAKNRIKSYTYNTLDQLTEVKLPVSSGVNMLLKYEYDVDGNITKTTKNSGITFENSYTESNLTSVVVKQNNTKQFETKYAYPTDTSNTKTVELLNGSGVSLLKKTFNFNDKDILTSYTQGKYSLGYEYDGKDRVEKIDSGYTESGQTLNLSQSFAYDANDKVTSLIAKNGTTSLLTYEYIYDTTNNKTLTKVNGGLFTKEETLKGSNVLDTIKYTKQGASSPSETYSYVYDGSGNITSETNSRGVSRFTYDGNSQLTKEELPGGIVNTYTYDEVGNRLTDSRNGSAHTFVYNQANQIITKNGVAYTYDLDGSLTQDEKYKYEYNALGQQTRVTTLSGVEIAKYEYDEDGLRTKKIIGSETREYYYESGNLTLEIIRDSSGIKQYRYYQWDNSGTVLGMIIREKNGSGNWIDTPYHFWTNHRGDVVSIVDNSGNVVGSYTYDAYGNILTTTGTIAVQNPIRYASYYFDSETSHYYLKARYYNPQNGSFLALDPYPGDSDDPISQNGYSYAKNNPIMFVDPSGLYYIEKAKCIGILAAVGLNPGMLLNITLVVQQAKKIINYAKGMGSIPGVVAGLVASFAMGQAVIFAKGLAKGATTSKGVNFYWNWNYWFFGLYYT